MLGAPTFAWRGRAVAPAALKAQALLTYLALSDRTIATAELAELLWRPDRVASVHQALHTLRALPGGEGWLPRGRGGASLRVRCDAATFERLIRRGRSAAALRLWRGEPFEGLTVRGAPAFEDWLQFERLRLDDLRREALRGVVAEREADGGHEEALSAAATLLALDPLDESTHRAVLRIHLRRGDLRAARAAFERCVAILDRDLHVAPLPETRELGDAIASAQRALGVVGPLAGLGPIPPELLRPRRLVGRDRELASVEAAWAASERVWLVAGAGTGKSRLAFDAAQRRGRYVALVGHAGDAGVPYASLARAIQVLRRAVGGAQLPGWVRRELGRLAPDPNGPPEEDEGPHAAARLGPAVEALITSLPNDVRTLVVDDLHAFDPDSRRLLLSALATPLPNGPAVVVTARDDELAVQREDAVRAARRGPRTVEVPLRPLDRAAVDRLLGDLGVGLDAGFAEALVRFTGGNPLFVVESLKDLHVSGHLVPGVGLPDDFDVPDRVASVIARRLATLDRDALHVLRVVALAPGADGGVLVEALELDEHRVAEAIGTATAGGLLVDGDAVHDVVGEVVRDQTPASVRRLLHRRLAGVLARRGASPGVVAWHAVEGATGAEAVAALQSAAEAALRLGPSARAMAWLERVMDEVDPASERYARALLWLGGARGRSDLVRGRADVEAALAASDRHGHADVALASLLQLASLARMAGAFDRAEALLDEVARRGAGSVASEVARHRRGLAFHLAWARGDLRGAQVALEAYAEHEPDDVDLDYERATLDWHVGSYTTCAQRLARMDRRALRDGRAGHVDVIAGLAAWAQGWPTRAVAAFEAALARFAAAGDDRSQILAHNALALATVSAGRFDDAAAHLGDAGRLIERHGTPLFAADTHSRRALVALSGDDADGARDAVERALEALDGVADPYRRSTVLSVRSGVEAAFGEPERAVADAAEALALAKRIDQPLAVVIAERANSVAERVAGHAEAAGRHAQRSLTRAEAHGMGEQRALALVARARAAAVLDPTSAEADAVAARAIAQARSLSYVAWSASLVLTRTSDPTATAAHARLDARLRAHSPTGRLLAL